MKIIEALKHKPKGAINYLKEVRFEMKKVTWPTKKEILRYTLLVLTVSFVVAIFLGALDFALIRLLDKFVL